MLCSLTFNLISLPNLHPLWPDHTSLNVDSSAGSLIFSFTHNHAVTTSDGDHIQPRLAANYPQLHLGLTTEQSLRYPSVFINSYDRICSMKWSEISIFLEGQQKHGCQTDWICTAYSKLLNLCGLVLVGLPVKMHSGWVEQEVTKGCSNYDKTWCGQLLKSANPGPFGLINPRLFWGV